VPDASALSNRSLRSVYNYSRRPILRTVLRPVQLFLVLTMHLIRFLSSSSFLSAISVYMYLKGQLLKDGWMAEFVELPTRMQEGPGSNPVGTMPVTESVNVYNVSV